jgi:hypothetical protein
VISRGPARPDGYPSAVHPPTTTYPLALDGALFTSLEVGLPTRMPAEAAGALMLTLGRATQGIREEPLFWAAVATAACKHDLRVVKADSTTRTAYVTLMPD